MKVEKRGKAGEGGVCFSWKRDSLQLPREANKYCFFWRVRLAFRSTCNASLNSVKKQVMVSTYMYCQVIWYHSSLGGCCRR